MRRKRRLIGFLLIFIILFLAGCGKDESQILENGARNEALDGRIIILSEKVPLAEDIMFNTPERCYQIINDYREMNGLKPLKWSPALEKCAEVRAREASNYWSHTRPNGKEWYTVSPDIMHGENLANGYTSAEDIVNAWIDSPAHNELLLAYDIFRTVQTT